MKIDKIYVLGHSGAGSTTLAEQLSEILKIPSYDMDDLIFIKKFIKYRSRAHRKRLVNNISKKKKWIIDSRGNDWNRNAMKKADLIIWLQTPFHKRAFRILRRFFQRRKNNEFDENLLDALKVVKYTSSFRFGKNPPSLNPLKKYLKENSLEPHIIKNNKDMIVFLDKVAKKRK